jgi:hypothetical protein
VNFLAADHFKLETALNSLKPAYIMAMATIKINKCMLHLQDTIMVVFKIMMNLLIYKFLLIRGKLMIWGCHL